MSFTPETPSAPQLFTRVIVIPPGAPWDQHRAARLDAAHGAPLAGDEVVFALRRLDPWRPRTSARYGVAYRRCLGADVSETVEARLEGRSVRFRFGGPIARPREPRVLIVTAAMTLLAGLALMGGGFKAREVRAAKTETLERLEANALIGVRQDRRRRQTIAELALVRRADGAGRDFADLAGDLWWLGQVRDPAVKIQTVLWSRGALIVTGSGGDSPVRSAERPVERLQASAGQGVWRIGPPAAPVVRQGLVRPSVVSQSPPQSKAGGS